MTEYAKGSKPQDMDAAKGGLVLDRLRSFIKDPDDFHPMGTGELGPENEQKYFKSNGKDISKRKGETKCKPMSILKKKDGDAL